MDPSKINRFSAAFALIFALSLASFGQATLGSPTSGGGGGGPLINNGPPPNCSVGVPYTFSAGATGGQLPYVWTTTPSTPVPGLGTINSASGVLGGNGASCTTPGTYPFTLTVCDANNLCNSVPFTIAVVNTLIINPGMFPAGLVGTPYTTAPLPTATGGTAPYVWSCPSCSYPSGLGPINPSTGVIAGTPLAAGTTNLTIKVTDSVGATATQAQSIVITSSSTSCGPPGYLCSSTVQTVIQAPPPPFTGMTGQNQVRCDPSINGPCSSVTGIDPIVRATDSTVTSDGTHPYLTGFTVDISGGSGDNIFSMNDTKIAVIPQNTGGICVLGFTASTMQLTNQCTSIPATHSMSWAHTDDTAMYGLSGGPTPSPTVWKTTFSSPTSYTQAKVFQPSTDCSGIVAPGFYTGGSVSLSSDDNIVYAAIVSNQQNSPGYVLAWNQTTHQCAGFSTNTGQVMFFDGSLHSSTVSCFPFGLHNSNVFLNGTYSRITVGAIGTCNPTALYWQLNTTNVFSCPSPLSGHNFNGWNIEVEISNPAFHWGNVTSGTYCSDINSQSYGSGLQCNSNQCATADIESHFSANYITSAETQPIIVGTSWANQPANTPWVAPTINELWAFQRSPFLIQRFFHLFNSSTVTCPSCDFRDTEGIVTQSQTGKYFAFCSDMNQSMGTSSNGVRIEVFIGRGD